ncbi:MAG: hypothetical protein ACUVRX_04750 [Actinomycetota bacterium]
MEDVPRLADHVNYSELYSRALLRVGRGMSVPEAVSSCAREEYPHAYRDVVDRAMAILERLKDRRGWGSLRALRELSQDPRLVEEMKLEAGKAISRASDRGTTMEVIADFPRIFSLALRKRQAGFSLEDALDMAVRELYPHTFRRTREAALELLRRAAHSLEVHETRALRELAREPALFNRLLGEGSSPMEG